MTASPEDAQAAVERLRQGGYEAYWVGGCVRDILLGRTPNDYDVVTDAVPDDVAALFERHHPVGKAYGVMLVGIGSSQIEVATYRAEQGYADRRRPDTVRWTDAKGDVFRRDFTVNGLLYDPVSRHVVDYVDGQRDLMIKIIRCIGDPDERIREDPLRILRAVRLKNALGFQYDQATYRALVRHAAEVSHVAWERIGAELTLMLGHPSRAQAIRDLDRLGLLPLLLPELEATKGVPQPIDFHAEGDVFDHLLRSLASVPADSPAFLAWAVLLHDIAKPATLAYPPSASAGRITTYGHAKQSAAVAERILRRFRRPASEVRTVGWLIDRHMSLPALERLRPHKREAFLSDPRFPWLLELHHADAAGAIPVDLSFYAKNLQHYQEWKRLRATVGSFKSLVNGHDLVEAGIPSGPHMGEILRLVRDAELTHRINSKAEAIAYAKERYASYGNANA